MNNSKYIHTTIVPLVSLFLAVICASASLLAADTKNSDERKMMVFITGANRGLGLEFATQFSANGYSVIGTRRKPDEATELKATGAEVMKLDVNTVGPILVTQTLLPNLQLSKSPRIINISTRASILSKGAGKAWGYSVSKTGLNMATRNMHGNLSKQGFIVISLAPGHNKTDMGTERGKLQPKVSISKMIPLIEGLTPKKSGGFWYYDGSRLPW